MSLALKRAIAAWRALEQFMNLPATARRRRDKTSLVLIRLTIDARDALTDSDFEKYLQWIKNKPQLRLIRGGRS